MYIYVCICIYIYIERHPGVDRLCNFQSRSSLIYGNMFEKHRLNLLQDDFIDNQKKTKVMGLSMMKLPSNWDVKPTTIWGYVMGHVTNNTTSNVRHRYWKIQCCYRNSQYDQ